MNDTALKQRSRRHRTRRPSARHLRLGATRCRYCQTIHEAIAAHHLHGSGEFVVQVTTDPQRAPIPDKLKALLAIAGKITFFTRPTAADSAPK